MLTGIARGLVVIVATLWLAGCASNGFSTSVSNLFGSRPPSDEASAAQANAEASEPEKPTDETTTGTVPPPLGARPTTPGLLGSDPYDELSLGKKYFRRAVESHPRDAEAWLGLAASYDRLRRFDLADRAYGQAVGILGPTAEILNNQGYSYMLRGDYKRAHAALVAAQRKDPTNKYVQNNLRLLEESYRQGKAIQ
jgi:Tfp pilus assembly protein PilF